MHASLCRLRFSCVLLPVRKEIQTRVFESEHPDVAASIKNIGIVYHNKGDRAAATEMFTKAYHIFLKVLGPHHPETQGLKPFVPSVHARVCARQYAPKKKCARFGGGKIPCTEVGAECADASERSEDAESLSIPPTPPSCVPAVY